MKRKQKARIKWTAGRERRFLTSLAATGNVALSARAVKASISGVYLRRQAVAAFRTAWTAALAEAGTRLEASLMERAINGVKKPVYQAGKLAGYTTEYADRTGLALLARQDARVAKDGPSAEDVSFARDKAMFLATLAEIRQRLAAEQ